MEEACSSIRYFEGLDGAQRSVEFRRVIQAMQHSRCNGIRAAVPCNRSVEGIACSIVQFARLSVLLVRDTLGSDKVTIYPRVWRQK